MFPNHAQHQALCSRDSCTEKGLGRRLASVQCWGQVERGGRVGALEPLPKTQRAGREEGVGARRPWPAWWYLARSREIRGPVPRGRVSALVASTAPRGCLLNHRGQKGAWPHGQSSTAKGTRTEWQRAGPGWGELPAPGPSLLDCEAGFRLLARLPHGATLAGE